jgi:hypothetical protein
VAVAATAAVVAGSRRRGPLGRSRLDLVFAIALLALDAVMLAPIWRCDWMGVFFRLLRSALVPTVAILAMLSAAARRSIRRAIAGVVLAGALAGMARQSDLASSYARAHPSYETGRDAVERLAEILPPGAVVVAPHGWQFFVTWITRHRAVSRDSSATSGAPATHLYYLSIDDPVRAPGEAEESCTRLAAPIVELAPGFRVIDCSR